MDKEAKKSKKKWSKGKLERADDLASRMMASKDFDGDWDKAFALSRWMENKGYEVKKKPGKPHKKYVPKKKSAGVELSLIQIADYLESAGLYKYASEIDVVLSQVKLAKSKGEFTEEEAKDTYEDMDYDFDFDEFKDGMNVELEHGKVSPETNITDDDPKETAQIAAAHLNELDNYYTLLDEMETKGKKQKKDGE